MKTLHFLLALILLGACTETEQQQASVVGMPSMPKADLPMTTQLVDAVKGGKLTYPSGTVIIIPENAFEDENGQPLNGQVEIEYREFHDMVGVLAADIPMTFTENGKTDYFETAGMFEIRGYQRGADQMQLFKARKDRKAAFIAKGKSLRVNMATFNPKDEVGFYAFNEATKQWEYRSPSVIADNEEKAAKLDAQAPMPENMPLDPSKFDPNTPTFDFNVNTQKFPELRAFKSVMWQYAGQDASADPANPKNQWVGQTVWTNVQIEASQDTPNTYILKLQNSSKSFTTVLKPVLRGKDLEKAKAQFNEAAAKVQAQVEKRKAAEEALAAESSFIRGSTVAGFGLFNHDIRMRFENDNVVSCNAKFKLKTGESFAIQNVYVLTRNNRGMVKQSKYEWDKFFYPKDDAVFVAILNNGRIAYMSRSEVASIDNIKKDEAYTFQLSVKEDVGSFASLQQTINSLWQ